MVNMVGAMKGVMIMVDEQTKRAVETMALCGCEIDALCSMFPQIAREDIASIWKDVNDARKNPDDEAGAINISCNCS